MDVIDVMVNYLRGNRRLVVPSFGTFVVKNPGEVLFSELLKTDDGVLRGLLAAGGLSELECAGAIDRFIFDVRNALAEKGRFAIGDLGFLTTDGRGEIKFVSGAAKLAEKPVAKPVSVVPKAEPTAETAVSKHDTRRTNMQYGHPKAAASYRRRSEPGRRGADWFMIAAIAVLLAAVAVMVYGYFCSAEQDDEAMMDSLRLQIEQPASGNE